MFKPVSTVQIVGRHFPAISLAALKGRITMRHFSTSISFKAASKQIKFGIESQVVTIESAENKSGW
jgi:hypothetical protein